MSTSITPTSSDQPEVIGDSGGRSLAKPPIVWGLVCAIYILPVALMSAGLIPFAWRYDLLIAMSILTAAVCWVRRIPIRDLGFRSEQWRGSLLINLGFSAVIIGLVVFLAPHLPIRRVPNSHSAEFYVFYLIVSAPLQEFLFRSVLFKALRDGGVTNRVGRILIAALTFSYLHLIYHDAITLAFTWTVGLFWCWVYERTNDVYGTMISHTVVGIATIMAHLI